MATLFVKFDLTNLIIGGIEVYFWICIYSLYRKLTTEAVPFRSEMVVRGVDQAKYDPVSVPGIGHLETV